MDSFAAYGSDSSQDDGIATESAAVPSFKPAWQTADEDDSEDESKEDAQGQKAEAPAAKEDHKPVPARADEPAVKRKKLPSALDALNTATPTFLASAPEPEPDEEESIPASGPTQVSPTSATAAATVAIPKTAAAVSAAADAAKAAAIKKAAADEKSKADKKTFKAKEKRKRDLGQVTRPRHSKRGTKIMWKKRNVFCENMAVDGEASDEG